MEYQTIIYEKESSIGTVILNRPKSMNALNSIVFKELRILLSEIERDETVKVVIVRGNEDFFAAGADLSEIERIASSVEAHLFFKDAQIVYNSLESLEKPVIAAISGFALGGGCELALSCDFRIAAENAKFGLPELKVGLIPGGGGTQRLPRLIGAGLAKELIFTGDFIDAGEAYRIGLVNKIFPTSSLMEEVRKIAGKIARQPGVALKAAKLSINSGINMDIKSAAEYEARCFEMLFSTSDRKEGTRAFVEKRKPVFVDR